MSTRVDHRIEVGRVYVSCPLLIALGICGVQSITTGANWIHAHPTIGKDIGCELLGVGGAYAIGRTRLIDVEAAVTP